MAEAWEQWHGEVVNGEFRLRQFLGGSDHSAVFLAERSGAEPQRVALKFIPANPATSADDLARWERARKLSHPHLLRILSAGRCQLGNSTFLYVVTDLADENLSQVIPQRPLTPRETRDMLRPVLDALGYLHSNGLAHGHIAPSNLMAVGDQIKLSTDTLEAAGDSRNGNHAYLSPVDDLPTASKAGVSKAADIWSLGATVVEVLTQRRTAWEETAHGEPLFRENLPEPFREIAKRCLHRDPTRRPKVEEIVDLLEQRPSKAKETTKLADTGIDGAPPPRSRRGVLIAVVALIALLAILGWNRLASRNSESAKPTLSSETTTTAPSDQRTNAEEPASPKVEPGSSSARSTENTPNTPTRGSSEPSAGSGRVPASTKAAEPVTTLTPASTSAGSVLHQVLPPVPQSARNTITGRVRVGVKVSVDNSGNVTNVSLQSPGPSKYFARLASQAAHDWKFSPPQVGGSHVPSEWLLRFGFGRQDTVVNPTQVRP